MQFEPFLIFPLTGLIWIGEGLVNSRSSFDDEERSNSSLNLDVSLDELILDLLI